MKRASAMFVLGMWVCGSVFMSIVATQNFYTIDRLLAASANQAFRADVDVLGRPAARELLRYLSSELNRLYFQLWNVAQIIIGGLALWLLWRHPSSLPRRIVVAMLGVTLLMTLYLQPQITSLGRSLDFVPRDPPPSGMSRFWMLHGAYTTLELLKLAAGAMAAWLVARSAAQVPPLPAERR